METPQATYRIEDLKVGDKVLMYIDHTPTGSSMGPGVEGNPKYAVWMTFTGFLRNDYTGMVCFDNGDPLGLPVFGDSIFGVQSGAGMQIIYDSMLEEARKTGRHFTRYFIEQFPGESPFKPGDIVATVHDYDDINRKNNIQNKHRVLHGYGTYTGIKSIHGRNLLRFIKHEGHIATVATLVKNTTTGELEATKTATTHITTLFIYHMPSEF